MLLTQGDDGRGTLAEWCGVVRSTCQTCMRILSHTLSKQSLQQASAKQQELHKSKAQNADQELKQRETSQRTELICRTICQSRAEAIQTTAEAEQILASDQEAKQSKCILDANIATSRELQNEPCRGSSKLIQGTKALVRVANTDTNNNNNNDDKSNTTTASPSQAKKQASKQMKRQPQKQAASGRSLPLFEHHCNAVIVSTTSRNPSTATTSTATITLPRQEIITTSNSRLPPPLLLPTLPMPHQELLLLELQLLLAAATNDHPLHLSYFCTSHKCTSKLKQRQQQQPEQRQQPQQQQRRRGNHSNDYVGTHTASACCFE